jgi:hypothetical protein
MKAYDREKIRVRLPGVIVGGRYGDTAIDVDEIVAAVAARIAAENAKWKRPGRNPGSESLQPLRCVHPALNHVVPEGRDCRVTPVSGSPVGRSSRGMPYHAIGVYRAARHGADQLGRLRPPLCLTRRGLFIWRPRRVLW